MNRRTFLRRSFLAAIGLAVVPRVLDGAEPDPSPTSVDDGQPVWSRVQEQRGRKDAFYAYGQSYFEISVKSPKNRLTWEAVPV